ncbi:OmpA family protein [Rhodobacteraceae bacterium HSP-20]|uniref:OmpA family protein n=1 Tax=Paragemmobacter amnigenus TaxID=2852097 RepID=A0ABS6IY19_9RHOB|nr:OmpA family protein [Rhodobacter amnigenus]MBU9696409.1 OmpA family protein [Rhodobacter amnigenus]MBV4387636.1 OmpA family protein [Rhodobacter amnigenus]
MKRILISTTALSVALTQVMSVPALGQTLTEDGSVIGADGSVLCLGTADAPCDLNAVLQQLEEQQAVEAAAAEAAAQAEAEAAAAAEAEAAAQAEAEAAAAAEAEAAAQAEAEAAAAAEAEAAAQAEAEAAAQAAAEAEAAAQAAAEEAARQAEEEAAAQAAAEAEAAAQAAAEAEAAAQAEAEAAAAAEAEAAAAAEAEAAAQAAAEAAAAEEQAVEEGVAEEPAAEEPVTEEPAADEAIPEEPVADEPVAEEPAADEPVAEDPAAEEPVAEEPVVEEPVTDEGVVEEVVPEEQALDGAVDAEATTDAGLPAEPVDETLGGTVEPFIVEQPADLVDPAAAEAPSEEALETLSTLLGAPDAVTEEAVEEAPALVPEAAAVTETDPSAETGTAENVVVNEITEAMTRTSAQDFAAPATASLAAAAAAAPEDDGLTDLQKFGLVALGALAVGAIINANRDQVVSNTGDRVVVRRGDGDYYIYKDDDTLLRRPGSTVRTETFRDGSTRTIVERGDGTQVVTIRDATGRVLRRATYDGLGREIVLIDDLYPEERIDVSTLPKPRGRVISLSTSEEDALLRARMATLDAQELGRSFSLRQIREIPEVRALAATVDVNNITFDTGSAAIKAQQAESLAALGRLMRSMIDENPNEMFLIEGHTDAVGSASLNLTLSDRRAESVALALTEYFDVPPENLVVQGYGESELRVPTQEAERQNRRVAVRIITPLLRSAELR